MNSLYVDTFCHMFEFYHYLFQTSVELFIDTRYVHNTYASFLNSH